MRCGMQRNGLRRRRKTNHRANIQIKKRVFEMNGTDALPNLRDKESVIKAIDEYFAACVRNNQMPQNEQLYRRLGISRSIWYRAKNGSNARISEECVDIIRAACLAISAYREQLLYLEKPPVHPGRLKAWVLLYDFGNRQPRHHKRNQETSEN